MRKNFILLALSAMLFPLFACAYGYPYYDAEIDGIFYKLNMTNNTACVVSGIEESRKSYGEHKDGLYSGDVVIPETVNHEGITYIVTMIDGAANDYYGAFQYCKDLTSITIPKTVRRIDERAFEGCTSLQAVYISDLSAWCSISFGLFYSDVDTVLEGIAYFSYETNPLYHAHNLYLNGELIKDLVIPEDVESVGTCAFAGGNFSSVTFHKNVWEIGPGSFSYCNEMKDVYTYSYRIAVGDDDFGVHGAFTDAENKTLHLPEKYKDNYLTEERFIHIDYGDYVMPWSDFGRVEYDIFLKHKLTYMVDGEVYETFDVNEDDPITPIPVPVKEGYTFSGWYELPETMPDEDVTVYGTFTINKYTLTYMVDGKEYKKIEVEYGSAITPEFNPTKEGYTFSGWSEIPATMPAEDVIIYGYFEVDIDNAYAIFSEDLQCLVGTTSTLKIGLQNNNEVKLCQFDLQLPDGVTVATKSNGKFDVWLTERAESHRISSQRLNNGNYRFIVSSLDNDSFTGSSGTLVEIKLNISSTLEAGEYTVKLLNAELSVPDGNDLKVVKPVDTESKLIINSYKPGDANNDGSVSVTDVGCVINYILEQIPSVFIFEAADMNGDNTVSVTDVGMIINFILSDGVSSRRRAPERNDNENGLSPTITLQSTAEGYELRLEDKDAYVGFQFDLELSEDGVINGVQLNGPAYDDHQLTYRRLSNGKWRVVCYSPTNSTFSNGDSVLLTITATGSISVSDICLTTSELNELRPDNLFGMSTGIANVEKTNSKTTLNLYSLGGNIYRILNLRSGINSFDGLRPGIYLIDNKKIVIR